MNKKSLSWKELKSNQKKLRSWILSKHKEGLCLHDMASILGISYKLFNSYKLKVGLKFNRTSPEMKFKERGKPRTRCADCGEDFIIGVTQHRYKTCYLSRCIKCNRIYYSKYARRKIFRLKNGTRKFLKGSKTNHRVKKCELCKKQTKTWYHHWNDSYPYQGMWLCNVCHFKAEALDNSGFIDKYRCLKEERSKDLRTK